MVGRIRRPHGIRGELVVEALTDTPDAVFAAGRRVFAGTIAGALAHDQAELHVMRATPFKDGWIVAFDGIADREAADAWRDRCLLLPGAELEPPRSDEVYVHDLVGMRVVRSPGGVEVGTVRQVLELPQGLMLEVRRPDGQAPVLLPFDDHTVTVVDSDARVIQVDPVPGLLD